MARRPRIARPAGALGRVALVGCVLGLAGAASACDCNVPPRSKPWRVPLDVEFPPAPRETSDLTASETARVEAQKRRDHTLRIHMDREPRHLNPMLSPSVWTTRVASDTIFESLIRYDPPEGGTGTGPGHYQAGLAESYRISPTGREIRFDLAPDVRFHDGRKLTAVDVQFSIDQARGRNASADHLRAQLADITAVELVGPRSVRVRMDRPNGYVLRALAEVPILPMHIYQADLTPKPDSVVGTGPYRLVSWQDSVIHLSRFDGYWGEKPSIRDIEFIFEPDAARALTAAKRGEFDIIPALIPEHYPEQASAPGLVSSFAPLRLRPTRLDYLLMNAGRPPLDDVRVREALVHLIDRKGIAKDVASGLARPVAGPIWPGGPGDGASPPAPEFDPATAATLLDSAGWRDRDRDGIRELDGKSLQLKLLVSDDSPPERREVRQRVVSALERTGIVIEQRTGSAAVLKNRLREGEFDLAFVEWRTWVDADLSPFLETGGSHNFGRFSDRQVDRTMASLRATGEPASRVPLLGSLARHIAKTWPLAPITAPDPYGLVHRRVRGLVVWNGWFSLRSLSLDPDA